MSGSIDPRSLGRSIADRIGHRVAADVAAIEDDRERSRRQNALTQQLRREVAFQRFLARIFTAQPEHWVLKGGVALQQRLDPSRASLDVDVALLDPTIERELALRQLRFALDADLGDLFTFELGTPREAIDEDRALKIPVTARLGRQQFAAFDVDIAPPRHGVAFEQVQPKGLRLGIAVLDQMPEIRLIALDQQVADKVCAMFELHGEAGRPSARSRDLGDLAMLAAQCEFDGGSLTEAVRAEEQRRRDDLLAHGLPDRIELAAEQAREWPRTWTRQARDPQFDFAESLAITTRFLDPVLAGEAVGARWTFDRRWHTDG